MGAFCPRGLAIKISIRFPRELSQPFLRPSSHLASVFSPLIKLHPRRANGGSTGLQRTHFVIISFNDEGSCHPSLLSTSSSRSLSAAAAEYFYRLPPSRWPRRHGIPRRWRDWKISGRARIRSLDRSTRGFRLLFLSMMGQRIIHYCRCIVNSNNTDFGGRK